METLTRVAPRASAPTVDTVPGIPSFVDSAPLMGTPVAPLPRAPLTFQNHYGPRDKVRRDLKGQLWVRLSTAVSLAAFGMMLMLIPAYALFWSGQGLIESGQATVGNSSVVGSTLPQSREMAPLELELASQATADRPAR